MTETSRVTIATFLISVGSFLSCPMSDKPKKPDPEPAFDRWQPSGTPNIEEVKAYLICVTLNNPSSEKSTLLTHHEVYLHFGQEDFNMEGLLRIILAKGSFHVEIFLSISTSTKMNPTLATHIHSASTSHIRRDQSGFNQVSGDAKLN